MEIRWLVVMFATSMLVACGGGGSNGGGNGLTAVVGGAPLTISAENAEEASAGVVAAIEEAFDVGDSALDFGGAVGARVEPTPAVAP